MNLKPVMAVSMAAAMCVTLCAGCAHEHDYRTESGAIWNTLYNITYRGPQQLADSILPVLNAVSQSVSVFDPTSVASRINSNESSETDSLWRHIYTLSREVWSRTDGAFDPTLGPLIDAWGFGKGHKATSDTLRLDSIMAFVGMAKTHLQGDKLIKADPRIKFNFSAVAKGYGCDAVAAMLRRNGVNDYLVEIGGEIRAGGSSPRQTPWSISIDAPVRSATHIDHTSQCIITLTDCGIATSGNYRNYRPEQAAGTGHTIDAHTGRPALTDVLSATVVAPTAAQADAYATALMALGAERGLMLMRTLDMPALIVTSAGETHTTRQFDALVRK